MNKEEASKTQPPLGDDSDADHANSGAGRTATGNQTEWRYKSSIADEDANPNLSSESGMPSKDLLEFSKKLLEQDPSPQLFVTLAEEFCSRRLWSEAVEICRRGLALHPNHFRGRVLLGWALWELGEIVEAERLLTETRQEFEKNAIIYSTLAEMAKKRGDSDQAWRFMHIYQTLVDSEHPGSPREHQVLGALIAEPQEEESLEPFPTEQPSAEVPEAKITELQQEETLEPLVTEQEQEETLEALSAEPDELEIPELFDTQPTEKEPSASLKLLSALQLKYEEKQIEALPQPRIFLDVDRKLLKTIIEAATS